jgi:thiol-disulfide isomerase/thioredoxin
MALILSACAVAASAPTTPPATSTPPPTKTPEPPPPTPTPTPFPEPSETLLPDEDPPFGADREFSTNFGRHSVPYSDILSGGPPKDGIPAIDNPKSISVEEADAWLEPQEPVILVQVEGDARAYPVQILMWHEIVNDTIGGVPVAVTFCPLCNTGIAFERTFDGQVLDFGTTGRLRFSNLVLYDRQTETWWQQATGEGIAGEYTGRRLMFVPASLISWADFKAAHPDGKVLSRDTGYARDYGQNPYTGYDDVNRSPFLYAGPETPDALPAMARVVTVELNDETVAYPYDDLQQVRVVNDVVGGVPIVVLWAPGTASALDAGSVAGGDDVGAATTFSREFDGQALTFFFDGQKIVDEQTGSEWDVLGQAVSGSAAGSRLTPVVSINHFWFSWAAFRPETRVYRAGQPAAAAPTTAPETASVELPGDFEIAVYQGEGVLGGSRVKFSDLFAQRRPVVLNLWAGLCPICRGEMPELQEAYEKYGDRVLFVGVDIGPFVGLGSEKDARALLGQLQVTYPAGNTPDATILRDYKVLGTPATYFFTPDGEIFQQWNGFLTGGQLGENIEALLVASSDT